MDFWALPPEINSGRLYMGPGSTPLLMAAAAWDGLSQQLFSTAAEVTAVIANVPWTGPSAILMRATLARYQAWLTATAAQAETTAAQARAAAAAFETARAATVHPALVAANRQQLLMLVATNLLGQNTPAIMATEAQYAEMWAQDVAAMSAYQAGSQAASQMQPFTPPPKPTTPVVNPMDTPSPGGVGSILSQLTDPGSLLNSYGAALVSSGAFFDIPLGLLGLFSTLWALEAPGTPIANALNSIAQAESHATTGAVTAAPSATAAVRASVGAATRAGALSAPPSWAAPPATAPDRAPTVRPTPRQDRDAPIPLPLPLPVARGGTPTKQPRPDPEYGKAPTVMPKHPYGG